MKISFRLFFLVVLSSILIVGCSENEESNSQSGNHDDSNQETGAERPEENEANDVTSNDNTKAPSENSSDINDEHIEHQEGLKMGETGIVEDDRDKYEVTLNSVSYDADATGGLSAETFAVVNITVKNIDDHSFNAEDIFVPGFGPDGKFELSLNRVMREGPQDVEQNLLEGEIEPGESVTGDHVFAVEEKKDNYLFIIGGKGQQIKTYAQWEVSDSEIED